MPAMARAAMDEDKSYYCIKEMGSYGHLFINNELHANWKKSTLTTCQNTCIR